MPYKHTYKDLMQVVAFLEKGQVTLSFQPVGTCYNAPIRGAWEFKMQYCDETLDVSAEERQLLLDFVEKLSLDYAKSPQASEAPFIGCAFLTVWQFTDELGSDDSLISQQRVLAGVLLDGEAEDLPFRFIRKDNMLTMPASALFYHNAPE